MHSIILVALITPTAPPADSAANPGKTGRGLTIELPVESTSVGGEELVPVHIRAAAKDLPKNITPELVVSLGDIVEPPKAAGPGHWVAQYRSPKQRHPAAAIFLASLRGPQTTLHGSGRVVLLGGGDVEVRAPAGAQVVLEFAGRSFGPQQADQDRKAVFVLDGIPPGETVYGVRIGAGPRSTKLTRKLPDVRYPRVLIGPLPTPRSTPQGAPFDIAVAGSRPNGSGYPASRLSCRALGNDLERVFDAGELAVFSGIAEGAEAQVRCFNREGHSATGVIAFDTTNYQPPVEVAPEPTPALAQDLPPPVDRTWTWVAVATAGAASVVGGVFGALAMQSADQANGEIKGTPDFRSARDDTHRQALAADIAWGTAVVAAGTALVLFLMEPSEAPASSP